MEDRVKVTMDRGVAEVRLNRRDKMNAVDGGMFEGLINAARVIDPAACTRRSSRWR